MDGIVWLVCSWVVVGLLSYIFVTRIGNVPSQQRPVTENGSNRQPNVMINDGHSDWVNEIIAWLSTYKSFPIGLSEHWVKALNEVAKKICVPAQNEVIFEETQSLPDASHHPKISNLDSCRNSNGQLVVRAHLEVPVTLLRVVASENTNNYTTITNYKGTISNLVGDIEARLAYIADEVYLMCCFNNCPEMNIALSNVDKPNEKVDYNAKLDSTIRKCITSAVMSINFHEYVSSLREEPIGKGNYFTDNYSYSENLVSGQHTPSSHLQYDRSLFVYQANQQTSQKQQHPPNKIRIKLVKAQRLNFEEKTNIRPYTTIEIDEPGQKFTSTPSHTVNPNWNENAEFTINELSDEVLFEVYGLTDNVADKNNKFLGLAIAGLGEMRKSNERIHNLQLQSRPYQNDRVSGTLTIQSEFYYDPYIQANSTKKKSLEKQQQPSYNKTSFAFQDQQYPKTDPNQPYDYRQNSAPKANINEVNQFYNDDHVILDNVTNRGVDFTELVDRPHKDPLINQQQVPLKQNSQQYSIYMSTDENDPPPQWVELENAQLISNTDTDDQLNSDNGRGRSTNKKSRSGKRERSFFGELRDRLTGGHSKAKKRAKSLDAQNPVLDEALQSEPQSRDQSQVRYERLSRAGTMERSTHSAGNRRSPAYNEGPVTTSKLVLELGEDFQEKKYYFIPDYVEEQLRATRIMKKGKKLHICNDHTFVAVKTKGGVTCDVCGGRIATNFAKQAYQCRDCRLVTHKQCHKRTGSSPSCPASTLNEKFVVEDVNWEDLLNRFQNENAEEFISGENL